MSQVPTCIGFIMDGNRRWAKARGLSTFEGHAEGYGALKKVLQWTQDAHIPHVVCYAFSTENWKRTEEEVTYLMQLLEKALHELHTEITETGRQINIRVIGQIDRLPKGLQEEIVRIEALGYPNPVCTLWIALSYGGRAEIIAAVQKSIRDGVPVTEENFSDFLWTKGMPDPDIIVRTSGEYRLSNFLLWQGAYSELFFTNTLWPDFDELEFKSILEQYANRQRRKGT